jgi:hypothetical protein
MRVMAKMRLARLVVSAMMMFLPICVMAWTSPTTRGASPIRRHSTTTTRLFNVPPPSAADDPVALKTYADREKPPSSFYELQINCARAAKLAMADGHLLLEIEVRHICMYYILQHVHSGHDTFHHTCVLLVSTAGCQGFGNGRRVGLRCRGCQFATGD